MTNIRDDSEAFYRQHAVRHAEVTLEFIQSDYSGASHPGLRSDLDLIERLKDLVAPRARGLDAGCGAGARDVSYLRRDGYEVVGIDALEETIRVAKALHPEIAPWLWVADLSQPLEFPDETFDFVLCNAVIQHIAPETAMDVTLPELVRVLAVGGVIQIMFKTGRGISTVFDRDFGVNRTFQLYDAEEIVDALQDLGMVVVPAEGQSLGGLIFFQDTKPMEHCVFYARRLR